MRTLLLFAVLLPLAGCATPRLDANTGPGSGSGDGEDAYRYTAYDEGGQAVVTGTLYLAVVPVAAEGEPDRLQGRWVLDAGAESVGPQDGEGTLTGVVDGETVNINLNPGMADNNVYLQGRFVDGRARMVGTWSYTTFVGPTAGGRFEARLTGGG